MQSLKNLIHRRGRLSHENINCRRRYHHPRDIRRHPEENGPRCDGRGRWRESMEGMAAGRILTAHLRLDNAGYGWPGIMQEDPGPAQSAIYLHHPSYLDGWQR